MRRPAGIFLLTAALLCLLQASRRGASNEPRRFPTQVVSPGPLPALWVFLRFPCPHCVRHLTALHEALERLPPSSRTLAGKRVHIVANRASWLDPVLQWHPGPGLISLYSGPTPCTWWVDRDSSIARISWGPFDGALWDRRLARLLKEAWP